MANNCTSKAVYQSLVYCPGEQITPGIRSTLFYIPARDITKWPVADKAAGKLVGNFELKTGKKWLHIKGVKSQGNVESAPQGEKPYKSFDVTANAFVPGLKPAVVGWANQAANDDLIFAVQEPDGTIKIVGYEYGEVDVNPTGATGSVSGDTVGETCAITCNMPYQPLAVEGIASLGEIDDPYEDVDEAQE